MLSTVSSTPSVLSAFHVIAISEQLTRVRTLSLLPRDRG